ncbi:MAG: hypothetical protein INR65_18545 [Gluconacetobacter diazotrophicus]|nr:hypothetical protein [Gluconacetobacter diazotrophicus]
MAQRRGSLIGSMKSIADQVAAEPPPAAPSTTGRPDLGAMTTTAVHIPKRTLSLLRRVSVARADRDGGRPSVSALLVDLAEEARERLERELAE